MANSVIELMDTIYKTPVVNPATRAHAYQLKIALQANDPNDTFRQFFDEIFGSAPNGQYHGVRYPR